MFITNEIECEAAQQQIVDYIDSGRTDDEHRIGQLVMYVEDYIFQTTGMPTMLGAIAALPDDEQDEAMFGFISKQIRRVVN